MTMEINGPKGSQQTQAAKLSELAEKFKTKLQPIKMPEGGTAQRKVTDKVINEALNEPNPHKVLKTLLANSPVGFGSQSTATELENLGYTDTGLRQHHIGAPIWYKSKDGGTVTVYDRGFVGNDGKLHTDAGPRTTVYKTDGFEQTMTYDENGKLTGGKIVIKDKVAGFTERQIDFVVTSDGKIAIAEEQSASHNSIDKIVNKQNLEQTNNNISNPKTITENFKDEIMKKLDTSKSKQSVKNIKYYLGELIEVAQVLNGVQKNNLKPHGSSEQNKIFEGRIKEKIYQMNDYASFVGSGLSVVQDAKTGLYKLNIDGKLYDIPERKVEIVTVSTEDGDELMPEIVD